MASSTVILNINHSVIAHIQVIFGYLEAKIEKITSMLSNFIICDSSVALYPKVVFTFYRIFKSMVLEEKRSKTKETRVSFSINRESAAT